jgi:hypothetical protein
LRFPSDAVESRDSAADAKAQLEREKGKMYDILRRAITDEEWGQITSRVANIGVFG